VWGQGGEMTQALYAHMNNKRKNKFKKFKKIKIKRRFPNKSSMSLTEEEQRKQKNAVLLMQDASRSPDLSALSIRALIQVA
jgi:hypothetical protein